MCQLRNKFKFVHFCQNTWQKQKPYNHKICTFLPHIFVNNKKLQIYFRRQKLNKIRTCLCVAQKLTIILKIWCSRCFLKSLLKTPFLLSRSEVSKSVLILINRTLNVFRIFVFRTFFRLLEWVLGVLWYCHSNWFPLYPNRVGL